MSWRSDERNDQGDPGDVVHARFSRRLLLLGLGQLACFGAVGARLYQLQVMEESRYVPLAEDNRLAVHILSPERGRIFDRFGQVLAANDEGFRATLIPGRTGNLRRTLSVFSHVVPMSEAEQERLVVRARQHGAANPLVLAPALTFEQVAQIGLLAPRLPGVQTERAPQRRYHYGYAFGHVVGHVGSVERLALDDPQIFRQPGLRVGKAGVELAMEDELRGVAGTRQLEVDARGRILRAVDETAPRSGRDVVLTLDTSLQARVMTRLGRERCGAVVGMDAATGEVLTMASVPSFDPGDLGRGGASDAWQRHLQDPDKPLLNRATGGLYPPGSTFKMVTALAALEAGIVSARDRVTCEGRFHLADQQFRCWHRGGHGAVDLERALKVSCDVYFYELASRVGIGPLARMARRLGLGEVYDCGIALQKSGVVPDPDWKRGEFGRGWLGGETVLAGIGQGFVSATPFQLAVMTARIATGRRILPTLIRYEPGTRPITDADAFQPLDISTAALDAVRRGMFASVNQDGGTGQRAALESPAVDMAGKTGTSQVSRASGERGQGELAWELRDHALFVGYAPADAPRYVVAVVIEHGGAGGAVAAPLAREVMEMLLADDPSVKPAFRRDDAAARERAAARTESEDRG